MNRRFSLKIVPPTGYSVFRLEFAWAHIGAVVALVLLAFVAAGASIEARVRAADARAHALAAVASRQAADLARLNAQTQVIGGELARIEAQDRVLGRLVGAPAVSAPPVPVVAPSAVPPPAAKAPAHRRLSFSEVDRRVELLRSQTLAIHSQARVVRASALQALNMSNLVAIAHASLMSALPSISPVGPDVRISAPFGWRTNPWPEFHEGVDLAADYGTPVHAAAAGRVVFAAYDGGYGERVEIDHGNGYHTWYCHLSQIDVRVGEAVTKTQEIGLVGSTGASTGPHLHYEVVLNGKPVDPEPFLHGIPSDLVASLK